MSKQKAKRKPTNRTEPFAALYGLDVGTPRGDAVRSVLAQHGIRVRTVTPDHLNDPVGAIVGMVGFRTAPIPFAGEPPQGEFMLLANVGSKVLDALLASLRDADAQVAHKALVTKYNRSWPFVRLMDEVANEHAALG